MTENKLIVALDVPTANEASRIFDELRETGCAFKIGLQLFAAAGSDFVRKLVERDAKIFLDLKFHDIPNTVANAAVEAARLGVWMFNVHAAGGREMMERTAAAVRETAAAENLTAPKIIAVTVLTSADHETLRATGIRDEPLAQVLRLAKLTDQSGLDGVVSSAQEAAAIRAEIQNWKTEPTKAASDNKFLIVTPGIRLQTDFSDDQKRVLTAGKAVANGADYLVVGRPILSASDKIAAVNKFLAEMRGTNLSAAD